MTRHPWWIPCLLWSCTDGADTGANGPVALTLLSPTDGATVCGDPLVVETDVQNFTLTNETIEDAGDNFGLLHVYLNGQEVAQSEVETVTLYGLDEIAWQLRVDLARANHEALDPYVGTTIYITVDNSLCTD